MHSSRLHSGAVSTAVNPAKLNLRNEIVTGPISKAVLKEALGNER
jgi:hypothetical protein